MSQLDTALELAKVYYAQFETLCYEFEDQIISWATEQPAKDFPQPLKNYPFGSLHSAALVLIAYLSFVIFGSLWQKTPLRVKLQLYPLQFLYNLAQIVLCSYMCVEAGLLAYRNNYTLTPCIPIRPENPPLGNLLWLFYVSKILDFVDTVFIISGQKWQQLSFLHVYHHTTIFAFYWLDMRVAYDGDIYLTILLNGVVHAVMYTYYFVSLHTKDIWWKKFLTIMQMIQFVLMCSQATYILSNKCSSIPTRVTALYLAYIVSLLILFLNFFFRSSGRSRSERTESKVEAPTSKQDRKAKKTQ